MPWTRIHKCASRIAGLSVPTRFRVSSEALGRARPSKTGRKMSLFLKSFSVFRRSEKRRLRIPPGGAGSAFGGLQRWHDRFLGLLSPPWLVFQGRESWRVPSKVRFEKFSLARATSGSCTSRKKQPAVSLEVEENRSSSGSIARDRHRDLTGAEKVRVHDRVGNSTPSQRSCRRP